MSIEAAGLSWPGRWRSQVGEERGCERWSDRGEIAVRRASRAHLPAIKLVELWPREMSLDRVLIWSCGSSKYTKREQVDN